MSKVLVLDSSYETCDAAIETVFETFPMDLKGKKVCLKVNGITAGDPHKTAFVTDYRFLRAVIQKVERLGAAEIVVGDSVGTGDYGKSEEIFSNNRIKETAGPYYKNFNKNLKFVEVEHPKKRTALVLADVVDADVLISLPKLKTHAVTRISGAVKNHYGVYAGLQKSLFHYESMTLEDFARVIAEVYALRKPDLVIVDGILAQPGYGPVGPETYELNKIMAGTDGVAIDTVFTDMIGLTVDEVPLLNVCRENQLGETDLAKIEVIGEAKLREEPWNIPPNTPAPYTFFRGNGMVYIDRFRVRVATRPVIDTAACASSEACARGALCVKNCPSGALRGGTGDIRCEKEKCMLCTSCMEWCPAGALKLLPDPELLEKLVQLEKEHYPPPNY